MSQKDYSYLCNDDLYKWKKYLLLVEWGLLTKERLLQMIRRYPVQMYSFCLDDIEKDMKKYNGEYTYIIKLVYKHTFIKLPNIRISSADDLKNARITLSNTDLSFYLEIWYCKNITKEQGTVFGRMMFSSGELFPRTCPIIYEFVWSSSARMIEKLPDVKCPCMSFYRDSWNASPSVTSYCENGIPYFKMLSVTENIIRSVSGYTANISRLGTYIFSLGCHSLCLEFKYHNDELEFIDWDSDNDYRVLQKLRLK